MHKITAIPKKGDPSLIQNYRPIMKVLETVVYSKIIDFIRPQISQAQFGFMCNRSSTHQMLACYSEVIDTFEKGQRAYGLYLDLRKAFDSVPHNELLFKLWRLGLTGPLWYWFKAYLGGEIALCALSGELVGNPTCVLCPHCCFPNFPF